MVRYEVPLQASMQAKMLRAWVLYLQPRTHAMAIVPWPFTPAPSYPFTPDTNQSSIVPMRCLQFGTILGKLDFVRTDTDTFQLDLHNITIFHPKLRVSPHPNTGRRASEDKITRKQRVAPAEKGDGRLDIEDHVFRVTLLQSHD